MSYIYQVLTKRVDAWPATNYPCYAFTDWRAVVDCILIETQYDGQVFNVTFADVPERKQDLMSGRYELPAPRAGSAVAVKFIDVLGEELVLS